MSSPAPAASAPAAPAPVPAATPLPPSPLLVRRSAPGGMRVKTGATKRIAAANRVVVKVDQYYDTIDEIKETMLDAEARICDIKTELDAAKTRLVTHARKRARAETDIAKLKQKLKDTVAVYKHGLHDYSTAVWQMGRVVCEMETAANDLDQCDGLSDEFDESPDAEDYVGTCYDDDEDAEVEGAKPKVKAEPESPTLV